MPADVEIEGPDGNTYQFPDGTDKAAAIRYFKSKGIGVPRSAASPIAPPTLDVGAPQKDISKVPTTEQYLLGGEPKKSLKDTAVGLERGVLAGAENVSTPIIAHRAAQKLGLAKPGDLYPEEASLAEIPGQATAAFVGGMEDHGPAEPVTPRGRTVPAVPDSSKLAPEQIEAVEKANRTYQSAKAQVDRREGLQQASKSMVQKTYDNLHATHDAARAELNQRWGALRQGMEGAELDPTETFNNIESAKAKYLKGSPASLSVFNNLAREMGIQEFMEGEGGQLKAISGAGKLPFDTARVHYSAIGDKLAQGNLQGNVYQALKAVEDGLNKQLTSATESRGLGKEYTSLKANEHQFRTDWTDPKSPLARAYRSLDPNFLEPHVLGRGNEYLTKQLERYRQHGAQPHLPLAARRFAEQAAEITKKVPEVKELPKPKAAAKGGMGSKLARVGGKVVGGSVGATVGHPFVGYAVGGEAGTELYDRITRPKTVPPPPDE
jgi:hypothetical protein